MPHVRGGWVPSDMSRKISACDTSLSTACVCVREKVFLFFSINYILFYAENNIYIILKTRKEKHMSERQVRVTRA